MNKSESPMLNTVPKTVRDWQTSNWPASKLRSGQITFKVCGGIFLPAAEDRA